MIQAVLPLDDCHKRENTFLLCMYNHLSATGMLEGIVKDVKELEKGKNMLDVEPGEDFLVIT